MSDSTNNIPQVSQSAIQRETTINALFADVSGPLMFGVDPENTAALTWGFIGGRIDGTFVADGTVSLAASNDNYVVAHRTTFVVTAATTTTNWNNATTYARLYKVVAGASTVTSYEDHRFGTTGILAAASGAAAAVAGSDTQIQYNNGGAFGGDSRLIFDDTNKVAKGQFTVDSSGVNAQTGTTYTLNATDNGGVVTFSNTSPVTVTVPSGLGKGYSCICININTGDVTFSASGVTLNAAGGLVALTAQHAAASLIAYVADVFNLSGNLA